jgi:hypothetical protein
MHFNDTISTRAVLFPISYFYSGSSQGISLDWKTNTKYHFNNEKFLDTLGPPTYLFK